MDLVNTRLKTPSGKVALLLLHCTGLALLTGSISFNCRQPDMRLPVAVDLSERGWAMFVARGDVPASERDHPNVHTVAKRPLMPALLALVQSLSGLAADRAFSVVRLSSTFVAYLTLFLYLRRRYGDAGGFSGTLFVAATVPLTFMKGYEVITDFPELFLFTVGFWLIEVGGGPWFILVVAITALNRETAYLLVLAYASSVGVRLTDRRRLLVLGGAALAFAGVQFGVAHWVSHAYDWPALYLMNAGANVAGLKRFLENLNPFNNYLFGLYLFGILWLVPLLTPGRIPADLKRMSSIIPVHLVIWLALGRLDEPRQLLCLYPLVLSLGFSALSDLSLVPDPEHASSTDTAVGPATPTQYPGRMP